MISGYNINSRSEQDQYFVLAMEIYLARQVAVSMKEQVLRMPQGTNKGGPVVAAKGPKMFRAGSLSGQTTNRTKTVRFFVCLGCSFVCVFVFLQPQNCCAVVAEVAMTRLEFNLMLIRESKHCASEAANQEQSLL